jgi:predicted helicase
MHYFVPKNNAGKSDYDNGVYLNDLFIVSNVGVATAADKVLIGYSREELLSSLQSAKMDSSQGRIHERLRDKEIDGSKIQPVTYRPFDDRYIYYQTGVVERSRESVMTHYIERENVGLLFSRMTKGKEFAHAFITKNISEVIFLSPLTGTNAFNAPLWLYHEDGTRSANLQPEVLERLFVNLKQAPEPEQMLDYIYAALYSPNYRKKYAEFLKTDFPRVPIPKNDAEFSRLAEIGKQLRELHLLVSPKLNQLTTTYPVVGSNIVEDVKYWPHFTKTFWKGYENEAVVHESQTVSINKTQYFGNVSEIVWNFSIGGYQPAQKWLKDRKGRTLTNDDIEHYQKIVNALEATHRVMTEIDRG